MIIDGIEVGESNGMVAIVAGQSGQDENRGHGAKHENKGTDSR